VYVVRSVVSRRNRENRCVTSGVGVLVGALVLLGTSGLLFVSLLRLGSATATLLGAYAIAWVELTVVALALSVPRDLTRTTCLVGLAACVVLAFGSWLAAARPPVLPVARLARLTRETLADPLLAALAIGLLLALIYVVILGIATPQVDSDSLAYHLPRAAFWKQQHAVAYISGHVDSRENANPPVAEIGVLLSMFAARSDRFVWLPQFAALLACGLAVLGIGRRLRLEPREAMLGALLFLSLPVSLMQAATALNDVVVASFVLVATYFAVGNTRRELGLAFVGMALALGTKVSAFFALPLLAVLVVCTKPRSRWGGIGLAGSCAVLVGGGWYLLNRVETGSFAGGLFFATRSSMTALPPSYDGHGLTLQRFFSPGVIAWGIVDAPGAVGRDALLFAVAAVLVAATLALAAWRRRSTRGLRLAALAGALALLPQLLPAVSYLMIHGWQKVWTLAGRNDVAYIDTARNITMSSPGYSWFGPLGFLLGVVSAGFVLRELRRRGVGRLGTLFVLAPLAWLVTVGWLLSYSEFDGRYLIVPVGLAAACWGVLFRFRAVTAASVAVALATMLLALVHFQEKPPGIHLLEPLSGSVWHASRAYAQTGPGDEGRVIAFLDRNIPSDAVVALPAKPDFLTYPFFGPAISRTVLFGLPTPERRADAIVFVHGPPPVACRTCWTVAARFPSGWGVLRRKP
jgi:hypothetical protein